MDPVSSRAVLAGGLTIEVEQLGEDPEAIYSLAMGVAPNGLVGGQTDFPGSFMAQVWSGLVPTPYPALTAGLVDVNSAGEALGVILGPPSQIAVTSPAGTRILTRPTGYNFVSVNEINDAGLVVGIGGTNLGVTDPFRWDAAGVPVALPALCQREAPNDINQAGDAAGFAQCGGVSRAVVWTADGTRHELPSPFDEYETHAEALNDRGQVVGSARDPSTGRASAVRWDDRVPRLLEGDRQAFAMGINDDGVVVGVYDGEATVWAPDGTRAGILPGLEPSPTDFEGNFISGTVSDDAFERRIAVRWTVRLPPSDPGTTPVGSSVVVRPQDQTGASAVTLVFTNVSGAGTSSVTSSGTGSPPPTGFRLGTPPRYYEVNTSAAFSGPIEVCISYGPSEFARPTLLRLFHDAGTGWQDVTTSNDVASGKICGTVTSLSPFLLAESALAWTGFFSPVDNPGVTAVRNMVKAGSSVPVKFSVGGNYGLGILASGSPSSASFACGAGPIDEIEQTVSSPGGLHYDAGAGQYVYVWKTDGGWKGTCRRLTLTLRDGQKFSALFQFR
jgi:hypothetical protein